VQQTKLRRAIERLRRKVFTGRIKSKRKVIRKLNRIHKKMQQILMAGERILRPKQQETFTEKLWELRRKTNCWRTILLKEKNTNKGIIEQDMEWT